MLGAEAKIAAPAATASHDQVVACPFMVIPFVYCCKSCIGSTDAHIGMGVLSDDFPARSARQMSANQAASGRGGAALQ
jgi:hypothetical protein